MLIELFGSTHPEHRRQITFIEKLRINILDLQLGWIQQAFKQLRGSQPNFPRGLRWLDLCCGGNSDPKEPFLPWLAEGMARRGAQVTGIDFQSQPRSMSSYTHLKGEVGHHLSELHRQGEQFDVVTFLYTANAGAPSPSFVRSAGNYSNIQHYSEGIQRLALPLIADNGLFAMDTREQDFVILGNRNGSWETLRSR